MHRWRRLFWRLGLVVVVLSVLVGGGWALWHFNQPGDRAQACVNGFSGIGGSGAPPLYLGLDAYRHLDKLSYLELGDRVQGVSTADVNGLNADNSQIVRVLPDGSRVLLDEQGPGLLTFMRMQEARGAPWRLSLDGQSRQTITSTELGQTGKTGVPPYPLSLSPDESEGSSVLAAPLPFQQHLVWSARQPNGNFYALYRSFPYGASVPTCGWQAPNADVVHLLQQAGTDIAPKSLARQAGSVDLAAGRATPLVTLTGPAQIRALTFRVPLSEQVRFGNARLRLYWDGEAQPSVDAPLKFLAGDGAGVYQPAGRPLVRGLLAGVHSVGRSAVDFSLYWPMPFAHTARILLQSQQGLRNVAWQVRSEPFPDPPAWWGTFHATYTTNAHPAVGQDLTFLDVRGSGKLVGTVINFGTTDPVLEGNPSIYLDDSQTPQIEVTGTEEWGLGGDYWHFGHQTSLALGGLPSSTNNPAGSDRDGAALYRFLVADSIPFNRHLRVLWGHGSVDQIERPYRAVMLWYGSPATTALRSDELTLSSVSSRAAHGYQATGETTYQFAALPVYQRAGLPISGSGDWLTGVASFKLALDPRNVGAFLRRSFDDCVPNQRADIYLDGKFAGSWYSAGAASGAVQADGYQRCWREGDFPLPASLTAGKAAVTVQVRFARTADPQNRAWTGFEYQLYSFVLTVAKG